MQLMSAPATAPLKNAAFIPNSRDRDRNSGEAAS